MRLNKFVQENFVVSRRKFTNLVDKGLVFLNDKKIDSYSHILSEGDFLEIKYLGIKTKIKTLKEKKDIIVFNKPVGFVCSRGDKHNKTIYDILPKEFKNYFYIGRLDKDSRGLLILTNNSDLVNKFQHPSNGIEKEYIAEIDRSFSPNDYKKIKKGIEDGGDVLKVNNLKYYDDKSRHFVKIILYEGKNRHIRRILESLGYDVLDLQRIREGQFLLGSLKESCWFRIKNL